MPEGKGRKVEVVLLVAMKRRKLDRWGNGGGYVGNSEWLSRVNCWSVYVTAYGWLMKGSLIMA